MAVASPRAMAQIVVSTEEKKDAIDYFALKTNLLEWTVAVPNLSVITDLSGKPWNRSVAGVTLKYKWKTSGTYVPSFIFNLFEVRPEYRYYINNRYSVGVYAAYDRFTTKLPARSTGFTGIAWGGGVSAGMELPLYQYRKSALDIEFGIALGAHYALRENFTVSEDNTRMVYSGTRTAGVLPYPELRVALVWRKTSVKDKYMGTNPMKSLYKREKETIDINFSVTNRDNFDAMHQGRLKVYQKSVFLDLYQGNMETYRTDFEAYLQDSFTDIARKDIEKSGLDQRSKNRLHYYVNKLHRQAMAQFDQALKAELRSQEPSRP